MTDRTDSHEIVHNPDGSMTRYSYLDASEETVTKLMREIFEDNWQRITIGPWLLGAVFELPFEKAPEVRFSNGYLTIDAGPWHCHLCVGSYEGKGNAESRSMRRVAKVAFYEWRGDGSIKQRSSGIRCTTERVGQILTRHSAFGELPFRLAPHLMHYAVLIILCGYLFSYLFSVSDPGRALRPGESIQLPDGGPSLSFEGFSPQYQEGARIAAFEGAILKPNVQMRVRHAGQERLAVLNFNQPIRVGGYGIYLNEFQPRRRRGGMGRSYVRLIIRRDPSSVIYRLGMGVFLVGLGLYVVGRSRRGRER